MPNIFRVVVLYLSARTVHLKCNFLDFKCTTLPHITTPDLEYKHSFRQLQPQLWDKPVSQPVERSYQRSTSDLMQQSRHSCKVAAIFTTQCIHANSTNISQPFEMGHWCNLTIWFLPNSSSPGALWLFYNLVVCCIQLIQVCGTVLVHPQDYSLIRMIRIRIFKSHLSPISFSAHRPHPKKCRLQSLQRQHVSEAPSSPAATGVQDEVTLWSDHWSHFPIHRGPPGWRHASLKNGTALRQASPCCHFGRHCCPIVRCLFAHSLMPVHWRCFQTRSHYNRATRCRQKQQAKDNCKNIWRRRIRLWFPRAYCIYLRVHWTIKKKITRAWHNLVYSQFSFHPPCLSLARYLTQLCKCFWSSQSSLKLQKTGIS